MLIQFLEAMGRATGESWLDFGADRTNDADTSGVETRGFKRFNEPGARTPVAPE